MFTRLIRLPFLGAFLFSIVLGQLIPQPDDVNIYPLHESFRSLHDLSVFKLFSPYDLQNNFPEEKTQIGLSSEFYSGGAIKDVELLHFWGGANVKNWSLLIEPVIVNDPNGQNILGTSFTRFGLSGRVRNAFLRYTGQMFEIQMGRSPLFLGQSTSSSIIHTTTGPTYDLVMVKINMANFQFEFFSGQLGADTTNVDVRIKRLTAGHRMIWIPKSKRLMISLGEQVLYTGQHRSVEFMYLNPFIPYFFAALEGDELYEPKDSDNSIIYITARYNLKASLSVYTELVIDDFQVDKNNLQNQIGLRFGADGALKLRKIPVTWEADITKIDTWANIHHGQSTSWVNRGHALGYLYGTDLNSVHFQTDSRLTKQIYFHFDFTWLSKGNNTLQSVYDNWHESKMGSFPSNPTVDHKIFSVSLGWMSNLGNIELGFSSIPFSNLIAYEGIKKPFKGKIFLKYQYVFQKGFIIK